MTATTPQPMEGTQAPSQVEYLYERYKHLFKWLLVIVVAAFAVHYGLKWQRQGEIDQAWTRFSASIGLEGIYGNSDATSFKALSDLLIDKELGEVETALAKADATQKPFILLVVARRAMIDSNWDRAESALTELATNYPNHSLVQESEYPVQVRELKETDEPEDTPPPPNKKPEYHDAVQGSVISRMREQIAVAKSYTTPPQFAKPEIPADATKVKFELSGDYGSFVIALMPQAKLHREKFLALVNATEDRPDPFWKDLNVDEVIRSGTGFRKEPMQFHLGFETTKDPDRTKWLKSEPSENQVEFEETGLSHFPGAVAARVEPEGMSCADRFWVCGEDVAQQDGQRVVFAYVVEGLDNVKLVCEAAMTAQDEETGRGVPTDSITVVSVTIVE